jgi:hypothetical protein
VTRPPETALDDAPAQRLHESLGYVRDAHFHRDHRRISRPAGLT